MMMMMMIMAFLSYFIFTLCQRTSKKVMHSMREREREREGCETDVCVCV